MNPDRDLLDTYVDGCPQPSVPVYANRLFLPLPSAKYDGLRKVVRALSHVILNLFQQFWIYRKQSFEAFVCVYFSWTHRVHCYLLHYFLLINGILPAYNPGLVPCGVERAESWLVP